MASGGEKHDVRLSKALSKLLRHDLIKEGLQPDGEGFVPLQQVRDPLDPCLNGDLVDSLGGDEDHFLEDSLP